MICILILYYLMVVQVAADLDFMLVCQDCMEGPRYVQSNYLYNIIIIPFLNLFFVIQLILFWSR